MPKRTRYEEIAESAMEAAENARRLAWRWLIFSALCWVVVGILVLT